MANDKEYILKTLDSAITGVMEVRNVLTTGNSEGIKSNPEHSECSQWGMAFAKPNELTKEMVKPVEEVASIHDMADKLRERNQELIRKLNQMEEKAKGWETKAKNWETAARKLGTESDNWRDTAALASCNADYYMDIVDRIASELGPDAFMNDEGVRGDSPIRAKLVEMVSKLCREHGEARYELRRIGSRLLPFGCSLTDDGAIDIESIDPTLAKALASGYWPFGTQCPKPTEPWAIPAQGPTEQVAMTSSGITDVPKLREELAFVRGELNKSLDLNASYKLVNDNLDRQIADMRKERDDARRERDLARHATRQQQGYRDTAIRERNEANRELAETNEALKIVAKERDSLTVSVRIQAENLKGCSEENKKVKKDYEYLVELHNGLQAETIKLRDAIATHSDAVDKLPALRGEALRLSERCGAQALTIKHMQETAERGQEAIDALKSEFQDLTAAYHGVNLAYNDLQRRASNARNALDLRLD